jgi:hypothetical protein
MRVKISIKIYIIKYIIYILGFECVHLIQRRNSYSNLNLDSNNYEFRSKKKKGKYKRKEKNCTWAHSSLAGPFPSMLRLAQPPTDALPHWLADMWDRLVCPFFHLTKLPLSSRTM